MADWQAIKAEYITTDTSYRKLAKKYDVTLIVDELYTRQVYPCADWQRG